MQTFNITLVSGLSGVGKTTWIRQQVNKGHITAVYSSWESGETSIDATYLAAEVSELRVLPLKELTEFLKHPIRGCAVYLELGFHIDLKSLILPENMADCRRVAVVSPGMEDTEWHDWADLVVAGIQTNIRVEQPHIWRSSFTGRVFDPASLDTFWYELTNGAYGLIQRAKGIFDLVDGRGFYFDFVAGLPRSNYQELSLTEGLKSRPDRFSGLEIVGEALLRETIAETLQDCCLIDQ